MKGEKDKLSMKQRLWLNYLRMAKAEIEVCHVHCKYFAVECMSVQRSLICFVFVAIGSKRTAKIARLREEMISGQ